MIEVLENFIAGDDPDSLADHFKNTPSTDNNCILSITSANPHGLAPPRGYLRRRSVSEILNIGTFPDNQKISVLEMHHPNLNFANRDTMSSSIFLQALPSIEISKAIPFLDMKVVVKNAPTTKKNGLENGEHVFTNDISIYKFLNGEKIEASNNVMLDLIKGVPAEILNPPLSWIVTGKHVHHSQGHSFL